MILDFNKYKLSEIVKQCDSVNDTNSVFFNEIIRFLKQWKGVAPQFIIRTSGTTGPAKELQFSRSSLLASANITLNSFGLNAGDIALHCLPMSFVAGKLMLVRAIVGKLKLKIVEPSSNPMKNVVEKIDFAAFTPHQMASILEEDESKLDLISTIILGGSKVMPSLELKLKDYKADVYETFGMSETLTHCAIRKLSSAGLNSKFKVLDGFTWRINRHSCLEISAIHLKHSPIITQDVVKREGDDHFSWLGRKDNVINTGGVKVYPEKLERKLSEVFPFPMVIGKEEDALLGEKVILYIEEKNKSDFDKDAFKAISFEKYEIPKEIRFIDSFPLNKNGKIERKNIGA